MLSPIQTIQHVGKLILLLEDYLLFDGDLITDDEYQRIEAEIDTMIGQKNWLVYKELIINIEKERVTA